MLWTIITSPWLAVCKLSRRGVSCLSNVLCITTKISLLTTASDNRTSVRGCVMDCRGVISLATYWKLRLWSTLASNRENSLVPTMQSLYPPRYSRFRGDVINFCTEKKRKGSLQTLNAAIHEPHISCNQITDRNLY